MIDGSDKLLMEHRDRQLAAAAERIAALEAEVEKFKSSNTESTKSAPEIVEYNIPCNYCVTEDYCKNNAISCHGYSGFIGRRLSSI